MFVCSELLSVKYTNRRLELGIRFETVLFISSKVAADCAHMEFSLLQAVMCMLTQDSQSQQIKGGHRSMFENFSTSMTSCTHIRGLSKYIKLKLAIAEQITAGVARIITLTAPDHCYKASRSRKDDKNCQKDNSKLHALQGPGATAASNPLQHALTYP